MAIKFKWHAIAAVLSAATLVPLGATASAATAKPATQQQQSPGKAIKNTQTNTAFPIGWNFIHATNCYHDTSGNFYVFPQEGGTLYTADWQTMNVLEPECAAGNWIGFYVYDSSGDWNVIFTYDYK